MLKKKNASKKKKKEKLEKTLNSTKDEEKDKNLINAIYLRKKNIFLIDYKTSINIYDLDFKSIQTIQKKDDEIMFECKNENIILYNTTSLKIIELSENNKTHSILRTLNIPISHSSKWDKSGILVSSGNKLLIYDLVLAKYKEIYSHGFDFELGKVYQLDENTILIQNKDLYIYNLENVSLTPIYKDIIWNDLTLLTNDILLAKNPNSEIPGILLISISIRNIIDEIRFPLNKDLHFQLSSDNNYLFCILDYNDSKVKIEVLKFDKESEDFKRVKSFIFKNNIFSIFNLKNEKFLVLDKSGKLNNLELN